jgi:hypothetical protein
VLQDLFKVSVQVRARQKICASCSSLTHTFGVETCRECGCVIAAKTRILSAACPLGKWVEADNAASLIGK